jgi:hypothetical protein
MQARGCGMFMLQVVHADCCKYPRACISWNELGIVHLCKVLQGRKLSACALRLSWCSGSFQR